MMKAVLNEDKIAVTAGEITVFNYDGVTREYQSTTSEYLSAGVGLPANSCIDAPGPIRAGFAICRTADFTAWEYVTDYRSVAVYSTRTGEKISITAPGALPAETTTQAPSTPFDAWNGSNWVTDTRAQHAADVATAEQQKAALLAEASAIIAPLADAQAGGYIDAADVPRLTAWQKYRYALTKADTSTAPAMVLPVKPVV